MIELRILVFTIAMALSASVSARGKDSYIQFQCARTFARLAGPIENLFLPKTPPTNDYGAWFGLIKTQMKESAVGAGAAMKVSTKDAPQAVETIKWMIGSLDARSVTKPWQVVKLQSLKQRLRDFEKTVARNSEIPWSDFLNLSADFAEVMGHRAPVKNYDTLTNNLVLTRDYVDRSLQALVAGQPFTLVMPTHRPLSVADMNDLSPYPIFPVELLAYRTKVDGQLYYPLSHFGHDLAHASTSAAAFERQVKKLEAGEITRAQYFKYVEDRVRTRETFKKFADGETPRMRNSLELLWFNITHENISHIEFTLEGEISAAALRQVADLKFAEKSALLKIAQNNLMSNDIWDHDLPKPTKEELENAFLLFRKFVEHLE